jgi:NAD(P)H-dependent FMN reductase
VYEGLGDLPLFNPDLEGSLPRAVAAFHRCVGEADALLIASPEYAHGVTGTIKNALDWLVGFEPFAGKCVAVINTSARARHADAALRETLRTMAAQLVEQASVTIPLLGSHLDEAGMMDARTVTDAVRAALVALQKIWCGRGDTAAPEFSIE